MNLKRWCMFLFFLCFCVAIQVLSVTSLSAMGRNNFNIVSVVLVQPDDILKARLGNADSLANYAKQIEGQASIAFNTINSLKPTTGAIVVAIKPGKLAKFWLASSEYKIPKTIQDDFQKRFKSLRPATVREGPVLFAMNFTVNGGGRPVNTMEGTPIPMPDEWKHALKHINTPLLIPDGVLKYVWP